MGKNKNRPKANVFKVAGAKSLKKTKAKAVNLGLKNVPVPRDQCTFIDTTYLCKHIRFEIKQKVSEMDKEFIEISKTPKPTTPKSAPPNKSKQPKKQPQSVSKEEVAKTVDQINKMDL